MPVPPSARSRHDASPASSAGTAASSSSSSPSATSSRSPMPAPETPPCIVRREPLPTVSDEEARTMIVVRSHLGRRSRIASPSPRRVPRPTRALASCRMMQPPTARSMGTAARAELRARRRPARSRRDPPGGAKAAAGTPGAAERRGARPQVLRGVRGRRLADVACGVRLPARVRRRLRRAPPPRPPPRPRRRHSPPMPPRSSMLSSPGPGRCCGEAQSPSTSPIPRSPQTRSHGRSFGGGRRRSGSCGAAGVTVGC